jgi:hypothetical protein
MFHVRNITSVTCAIVLASCASSSEDIATAYVSPTQYSSFSCDQLQGELARLNRRKSELAGTLDKAASNDETIAAVSIILFWPAAFALGGNDAQEAEYARLKGEYDAITQIGVEKNCNLDPSKVQTPRIAVSTIPANSKLAIGYYAQAEDEVDTGNYDRNLWSQAYVMVEGDEKKRKAKYIELRANQLYSENAGPISNLSGDEQPASTSSAHSIPAYDVAGTYASEKITRTTGYWYLNLKSSTPEVKIQQTGGNVKGTFGKGSGNFDGVIVGDTITIEWYTVRGRGTAKWTVIPENNQLVGVWSAQNSHSSNWNLKKVQ